MLFSNICIALFFSLLVIVWKYVYNEKCLLYDNLLLVGERKYLSLMCHKNDLTTMGCPLADVIKEHIIQALKEVPEVSETKLKHVWYPAWTTDRMSRYARIALGIR